MTDHSYFTRSRACKNPSPVQNPLKRKRTDYNDDSSLTEDTVTDPIITQNELIAQLIQQIGDMKIEIKKTQEMAKLAIAVNPPALNDRRPSLHPSSPNLPHQPSHPQPTPSPSPTFNAQSAYHPSPTNHQIPSSRRQHPQSPNFIPNFQPPSSNYQAQPCSKVQILVYPRQSHPNHHRVPPAPQNNFNPPYPNADRKTRRIFTPLAKSRAELFERLSAAGLIQPIPPKALGANSRFLKFDRICAYHSNGIGHNTEDCINLKHRIQDLIDNGVIVLVK